MIQRIHICSNEEALARLADGSLYDFLASSAGNHPVWESLSLRKIKENREYIGGARLEELVNRVELVAGDIAMVSFNDFSRKTTLYRKVNGVWVPRDAFDVRELAAKPESRLLCTQATMNGFGRGASLVMGLAKMYDKVDWSDGYDRYYWLGREMCWHVYGDKIEALSIADGVAYQKVTVPKSADANLKKHMLAKYFPGICGR